MYITDEKLAYVITRYTFRECGHIEDIHAELKQLDMTDYSVVQDLVQEKLEDVWRNFPDKKPHTFPMKHKSKTELDEILKIGFVVMAKESHEWQPPVIIDEPLDTSFVEYMLRGRFKTACQNNERIDDAVIKEINIDVCNRVYTMIKSM